MNLSTPSLNVGGISPFTTIDYPRKLACVVFVQGCPWRCTYCHNPHLQARTVTSTVPWQHILQFLTRRQGLIDAVVFSGGEPTLDPALPSAIEQARALGFAIGLHTAGMYPQHLKTVLPFVDWVGFDIKGSWQHYDHITGIANSAKRVQESLDSVLQHTHCELECRTTIHPALHNTQELYRLITALSTDYPIQHYALQVFRRTGCQNNALNSVPFTHYPPEEIIAYASAQFPHFILRDA